MQMCSARGSGLEGTFRNHAQFTPDLSNGLLHRTRWLLHPWQTWVATGAAGNLRLQPFRCLTAFPINMKCNLLMLRVGRQPRGTGGGDAALAFAKMSASAWHLGIARAIPSQPVQLHLLFFPFLSFFFFFLCAPQFE